LTDLVMMYGQQCPYPKQNNNILQKWVVNKATHFSF